MLCVHCASELMSKYDVIHKTGSTQHLTTPPEEDRATAVASTRRFGENLTRSSEDMIADKHTQTDRQTDMLITILRFTIGGGVTIEVGLIKSESGLLCIRFGVT